MIEHAIYVVKDKRYDTDQWCKVVTEMRPALRQWLTITLTLTLTYFRPMMIDVTAGLVLVTAVVQHVWLLSRFGDLSDAH